MYPNWDFEKTIGSGGLPWAYARAARRPICYLFCLACLGIVSGCATMPSPQARLIALEDFKQNRPLDPTTLFEKEVAGKDRVLVLMERGRLAQMLGNLEASKASFDAAIETVRDTDEKAVVSATKAGSQVAAVLVNDNAIAYSGAGFERILLRHFQALNYLACGELEGAGVEVRNANFEQEQSLKWHEAEVEDVKAKTEEKKVDLPKDDPNFAANFSAMDEAAGKVKNSFQNQYRPITA